MIEETKTEMENRKARIKELIDEGVLGNNTSELTLAVKEREKESVR